MPTSIHRKCHISSIHSSGVTQDTIFELQTDTRTDRQTYKEQIYTPSPTHLKVVGHNSQLFPCPVLCSSCWELCGLRSVPDRCCVFRNYSRKDPYYCTLYFCYIFTSFHCTQERSLHLGISIFYVHMKIYSFMLRDFLPVF